MKEIFREEKSAEEVYGAKIIYASKLDHCDIEINAFGVMKSCICYEDIFGEKDSLSLSEVVYVGSHFHKCHFYDIKSIFIGCKFFECTFEMKDENSFVSCRFE